MIQFFVPGLPKTAGSKRAFMRPGMKFPIIVDDCKKTKDWQADVKAFAHDARPETLLTTPLKVSMNFGLPRPKGHFGTGANAAKLRDGAPPYPISKPDLLKMSRAIEDALTGIIYRDDAQIVLEILEKSYAQTPGCFVSIEEL